MKSYSANYPLVIARSHVPSVTVLVVTGDSFPAPLQVVGGDVTMDRTAELRTSMKITVVDPTGSLVPSTGNDFLLPFIHEVSVYRGVPILSGTPNAPVTTIENFLLGIFRLTSTNAQEQNGQIRLEIDGMDRAERVRAPLRNTFTMSGTATTWIHVIQNLISLQLPSASFAPSWPTGSVDDATTIGTLRAPTISLDTNADAWAKCREGAAAIGKEIFVNANGQFELGDIPSVQVGAVQWEYVEGGNATHMDTTKTYSSENIFNGVVVTSTNSSNSSIRGEAWDDNPESKTSRTNIGPRPKSLTLNLDSQIQAEASARVELGRLLSGSEKVTFTAIPNPALEVGDLISYQRTRLGLSGTYLVNRIVMPLDKSGLMTVDAGKN